MEACGMRFYKDCAQKQTLRELWLMHRVQFSGNYQFIVSVVQH